MRRFLWGWRLWRRWTGGVCLVVVRDLEGVSRSGISLATLFRGILVDWDLDPVEGLRYYLSNCHSCPRTSPLAIRLGRDRVRYVVAAAVRDGVDACGIDCSNSMQAAAGCLTPTFASRTPLFRVDTSRLPELQRDDNYVYLGAKPPTEQQWLPVSLPYIQDVAQC